jgi:hypothetical protein
MRVVKKTTYYITTEDETEYRTDDKGKTWEIRMGESWETEGDDYGITEKFLAELNKMCSSKLVGGG